MRIGLGDLKDRVRFERRGLSSEGDGYGNHEEGWQVLGGDRLGALATTRNLDHYFRDMPDGARDLFDLSRQQP